MEARRFHRRYIRTRCGAKIPAAPRAAPPRRCSRRASPDSNLPTAFLHRLSRRLGWLLGIDGANGGDSPAISSYRRS